MAPPAIRLAQHDDFEAIATLTNVFIRDTAVHFGYEPVSADELRAAWQGGAGRYPWLVAAIDGEFAGYAKAGAWRERAAYAWTVETGIYVVERRRGQGVARALYGALIDLLRTQGYRSIVAGATLPNAASVALHERLGFEPVGVVRAAGFKLGGWHDVAFFQLPLHGESVAPTIRSPAEAWVELRSRSSDALDG